MISLVFPFYNEAVRFSYFENTMNEYLEHNNYIKEIILVNDGSSDKTLELLINFQKKISDKIDCKIINLTENKGKGVAIKSGILSATQKWVLCNDADLSYPPNQLDEWIDNKWIDLDSSNNVYFGSRELGQEYYQMNLFFYRRIIGKLYIFLAQNILGITTNDTQCGFKLYDTELAKSIFNNVKEKKFAFDTEVLYILKKRNITVTFLPVKCTDISNSKVHLFWDGLNMFEALFRIKKNH